MWKIKVWQSKRFSDEFKYEFGIRRKGTNMRRYKGRKLARRLAVIGIGRVC